MFNFICIKFGDFSRVPEIQRILASDKSFAPLKEALTRPRDSTTTSKLSDDGKADSFLSSFTASFLAIVFTFLQIHCYLGKVQTTKFVDPMLI